MPDPVSSIRNLGPASDEAFARAGLHTAEEVRALGADATYLQLLNTGSKPHFIAYYALVMGLQGRPWNDAKGAEKDALRVRFDTLKAQASPTTDSAIERLLDEIGTGLRRT
ncbi:TfoX/Sxy family DNA transformation protein [Tropicimonas sp. S265A]|uniref:TfoX/Sxy family DNA transformation protein n=1 Tax=Tropicimonas sp. S265A TaxID=3415134 RepID=UPI003C7B8AAA